MCARYGRLTIALLIAALLVTAASETRGAAKHYTNGWAIKIDGDHPDGRAKIIAKKYGFETVKRVGTLDGYYHLEHPLYPRRSKRGAEDKTEILLSDNQITWATQLHELHRQKRDISYHHRVKRGSNHDQMISGGMLPQFTDPLWEEQWYLDDKRQGMNLDLNVIPAWHKGLSGKGVVVTILDDGVEHNHTDLRRNYDPDASWDINDNDPDPFPRYDPTNENKHGTRCAGEVAAEAGNKKCGVGVAFNAKIGGVRMLDGRVTDRVEAESLSLNPQHIDIYSASWGPSDDGQTVEGPGQLAAAAFKNGIEKGRGGLGSIYVWASGNGGRHDDSCNCDGYTASIYTLSISSSSDHGESPWYSEACASTLASTLSSGAHGEKRIVTTDLHDQCTERHTGTSASAPLAAGLIALVLEKNPKLTWRDVQHIVATTANWEPLKHDSDWRPNGIGLHVNEKFGFGLLDAEGMVTMADPAVYKNVAAKRECVGKVFSDVRSIQWDQTLSVDIPSSGCVGRPDDVRYLEHVQLVLTITYPRRGDLNIFVTTPMGTRSCLLPVRGDDTSEEGFKKWKFMTTHAWGEDPRGVWRLEIKDGGDSRKHRGQLRDWQLILHGTKEKPGHQKMVHPEQPPEPPPVLAPKKPQTVKITKVSYTFNQKSTPSSAHAQLHKLSPVLSILPSHQMSASVHTEHTSSHKVAVTAVVPSAVANFDTPLSTLQQSAGQIPYLSFEKPLDARFPKYATPTQQQQRQQQSFDNPFQRAQLVPRNFIPNPQPAYASSRYNGGVGPSYASMMNRDAWTSVNLKSLVQPPNSFYSDARNSFAPRAYSSPAALQARASTLQIPQKTGASLLARSNFQNPPQRFAASQDPRFWRHFSPKRRSGATKRRSERDWVSFEGRRFRTNEDDLSINRILEWR